MEPDYHHTDYNDDDDDADYGGVRWKIMMSTNNYDVGLGRNLSEVFVAPIDAVFDKGVAKSEIDII